MSNLDFIDHSPKFDPLASEREIDNVSLAEQFAKLTNEEKELVALKATGYQKRPPSIEEFYTDDFYLGNEYFFNGGTSIFDYWKKVLTEIYPSRMLTAKPYQILSGAIGLGKSTMGRIQLAYTYSRLLCLKNAAKTLGIARRPLSAIVFHVNSELAQKDFVDWFKRDVLELSPFFRTTKNPQLKFNVFTGSPRSRRAGLGTDLIWALYSEINFWGSSDGQDNPNSDNQAVSTLNTGWGRMHSRFSSKTLELMGNFILDSSANGDASATERFEELIPNKKLLLKVSEPQWNVRPELYPELKEPGDNTFLVYAGDPKTPPQKIYPDEKGKVAPEFDPDRIIKMPNSLMAEANMDLRKCLMDKAGVPLAGSSLFFNGDISHMIKCMERTKNYLPEITSVDFFDLNDRLYNKIKKALELIPYRTPLWIGLDLSSKHDLAGLSIIMLEGKRTVNKVEFPLIRSLVNIGISRIPGQQTSISHFYDLIKELSKYYDVRVSSDSSHSAQLLQDLERDMIPNRNISTDRLPEPAQYLKSLINLELIKIPVNHRLLRETYDLKYVTTPGGKIKVDHPIKASSGTWKADGTSKDDIAAFDSNDGIGSKDIFDSLEQACWNLRLDMLEGTETGVNPGYTMTMRGLENQTEDAREISRQLVQSMVESVFD